MRNYDKYTKQYYSERAKKYRKSTRERILDKYGRRCNNPACQWLNADGTRGCTDTRCLQLDHIDGGGNKERDELSGVGVYLKALNDMTNSYQLLCANCNWIKRT